MDVLRFNRLIRKADDTACLTALYEDFFPRIVLHLTRLFGDEQLAKDTAQDFFIKLPTIKIKEYIRYPTSWVMRLCENAQKDYYRRHNREAPLSEELPSPVNTEEGLHCEYNCAECEKLANMKTFSSDTFDGFYWNVSVLEVDTLKPLYTYENSQYKHTWGYYTLQNGTPIAAKSWIEGDGIEYREFGGKLQKFIFLKHNTWYSVTGVAVEKIDGEYVYTNVTEAHNFCLYSSENGTSGSSMTATFKIQNGTNNYVYDSTVLFRERSSFTKANHLCSYNCDTCKQLKNSYQTDTLEGVYINLSIEDSQGQFVPLYPDYESSPYKFGYLHKSLPNGDTYLAWGKIGNGFDLTRGSVGNTNIGYIFLSPNVQYYAQIIVVDRLDGQLVETPLQGETFYDRVYLDNDSNTCSIGSYIISKIPETEQYENKYFSFVFESKPVVYDDFEGFYWDVAEVAENGDETKLFAYDTTPYKLTLADLQATGGGAFTDTLVTNLNNAVVLTPGKTYSVRGYVVERVEGEAVLRELSSAHKKFKLDNAESWQAVVASFHLDENTKVTIKTTFSAE